MKNEIGEIGYPKYTYGDRVYFELTLNENTFTCYGRVFIVDAYGTYEQNEEPSYDILVEDWIGGGETRLVKHIRESEIRDSNNKVSNKH